VSRRLPVLAIQEAVPVGVKLCGGDEMDMSIAASTDTLIDGDESLAVFDYKSLLCASPPSALPLLLLLLFLTSK